MKCQTCKIRQPKLLICLKQPHKVIPWSQRDKIAGIKQEGLTLIHDGQIEPLVAQFMENPDCEVKDISAKPNWDLLAASLTPTELEQYRAALAEAEAEVEKARQRESQATQRFDRVIQTKEMRIENLEYKVMNLTDTLEVKTEELAGDVDAYRASNRALRKALQIRDREDKEAVSFKVVGEGRQSARIVRAEQKGELDQITRPTIPGHYWFRGEPMYSLQVIEVQEMAGHLAVFIGGNGRKLESFCNNWPAGQWWGPIQLPV